MAYPYIDTCTKWAALELFIQEERQRVEPSEWIIRILRDLQDDITRIDPRIKHDHFSA